ncbi:MAG: phosphatase PAP2 family protein [Deltaproteobacteria bacterium]|nr:phosphatase PAP2 family protein [Deltaproteobacteria bacterium]
MALFLGDLTGGLWEGGSSRPGKTYWQSLDAIVLGTATTQAMKYTFTRARPSQTDDPGKWFQGGSHYSFPSGEVAAVSAAITPFILEYGHDNPWVYGLEVLPAYDAAARMKVWGHWQSDVLVGFAVGTLSGYLAHNREQPFILNLLPDGASIGFQKSW